MMNTVDKAVQDVLFSKASFCKFLSANDTSETGAHQSGIYVPKNALGILFDEPGEKGSNKDRMAEIEWDNGLKTENRFIYYGKGTRNEYRITRFGKGLPYLRPEYTGSLLVLNQRDPDHYTGYVFSSDDDITRFLDSFGMTPVNTNRLIETGSIRQDVLQSSLEQMETEEIHRFIEGLKVDFPASSEMSRAARTIQNRVWNHEEEIITNPDRKLVEWTSTEYHLFQELENHRYGSVLQNGFTRIEDFISMANTVLNRRKSRAGKSLEHHLSALFDLNGISFEEQVKTEGNKRPDFVFPSGRA
ncbi:MAG: hypothetical protein HUJ54_08425, partial [Erysipelotrichaceae bacterium]|nr:hypothetical protein [Erysipelotrichaceae bacterium]